MNDNPTIIEEEGKMIEEMDELKERVKELNCFYAISDIVRDKSFSLDEALNEIVKILPPSWQYEDIAEGRIKVGEKEFTTDEFVKTDWCLSSEISVSNEVVGFIEVCYLEQKPEEDDGPFLEEEIKLINAISDYLGTFIEERWIREKVEDHKVSTEEKEVKEEKQDWEVIIDLLKRTDPRTLLRMTRKMVYHLYRNENEKIRALLTDVCPIDPVQESPEKAKWCGINMPNPKQDIDSLLEVQEKVFEVAKESLTSEEISELFHQWLKEDKARPILMASQKRGIPLHEIKSELNSFFDKPDSETALSLEDRMSIKSALIPRFFTNRLEFITVAKNYFEVEEFVPLLDRVVGPPQGAGKLGGKSSGVYLAERILEEEMADEKLENIAFPNSWYITSDTMLELIRHNDLDEMIHIKYLDPEEIRQEEPFIEQIMKNAVFSSEITDGLKKILREVGDNPIIVRSSSLLEDNFGAAFSGKYKSLFLANTGSESEKLEELMNAILEVYASTFRADPIEYRRERGLLDFNEEMGVLIQEVVGNKVGDYYLPTFGGVAFSKNEFKWSPRISRDDGVIRMVPGLATRAVDRIGDDYPVLVSPNRPELRVNTRVEDRIKYSPLYMDVINLKSGAVETVDAIQFFRDHPNEFPGLDKVVSIHQDGYFKEPSPVMYNLEKDDLVVTFSKLFKNTEFLDTMNEILDILENVIGTPVDVEFTSDGEKIYIVQCRPQSESIEKQRGKIPKNIQKNRKLFKAHKYVTNGIIENIKYIVYVVPEGYSNLDSKGKMQEVAEIVGELNNKLPRKKFILIGPGRWGSRGDIRLGVPVRYREIHNTSMLVEVAKKKGDYQPELSFGTHFFQDLVEANIKYLPLYPDNDDLLNEELIFRSENKLNDILSDFEDFEDIVRVIDVESLSQGGSLSVFMDGELGEALAYLEQPDHWEWRMNKVKKMGKELDPDVYGVEGLYVVGSTKEATAGPESDIDLIVHFNGTEEQKDKLKNWFDRWDKKLCEENEERVGKELSCVLDIHFITDKDIEKETSWASHITSRYKSAREIDIRQDE